VQTPAVGVEQPRAVDQDREALRERDRDIQTMIVEEEVDPAGRLLAMPA
jgi:hypothetical protein